MDFPPGPSRRSRSRSPVRGSKNKVLTDDELLRMLRKWYIGFSSEKEFVGDSDNNYLTNDNERKCWT